MVMIILRDGFRKYNLYATSNSVIDNAKLLLSTNDKSDIEKELKLMGFQKYKNRIRDLENGIVIYPQDGWGSLNDYLNKKGV